MSSTTDEFWSVNGVSLQTMAFNVVTVGGKYQTPKMRGSDRQYAYQHGTSHRRRWAEEQTLTLGMWVLGQEEDGRVPASRRDEFRRNMRKLQGLFTDMEGGEFELTKRWHDEDTGALMEATGRGLVPDGLRPEMEGGPYRAKFVVDVLMADPFFYGAVVTTEIPVNTDVTVNVAGDLATQMITADFVGQLTNPLLTNKTPSPDVTLKVGSAIAGGDRVMVNVPGTWVKRAGDGANLIGAVQHSGARPWFELKKGANVLRLSADGGAGSVTLTHQPVWY